MSFKNWFLRLVGILPSYEVYVLIEAMRTLPDFFVTSSSPDKRVFWIKPANELAARFFGRHWLRIEESGNFLVNDNLDKIEVSEYDSYCLSRASLRWLFDIKESN